MINTPRSNRISDPHATPQNVPECPNKKSDSRRRRFSDRQRLALELILQGNSLSKVAKNIKINRRTLFRWRHQDQLFIAELTRRRQAQWDALPDKLRSLLDPAVDVLADQLNAIYEPTRFRAAIALLRMADVKRAIAVSKEPDR